jgi:hypothetical protein
VWPSVRFHSGLGEREVAPQVLGRMPKRRGGAARAGRRQRKCDMVTRDLRLEGRTWVGARKGRNVCCTLLCITSIRWWACHGGATEHASEVTSVHREQAQHEGWRHRHASEG